MNKKGFTVIELLIATVVFGLVLLIVTIAVIQFNRVYYRGVTETTTQEVTRSIVDTIAQSIQFNGGAVTETPARVAGSVATFCVGNKQYTYRVGLQLTEGTLNADRTYHALVVRDLAGCTSSSPGAPMSTLVTSGQELLSPNMRLAKMVIHYEGSNLYKISVRVVYGDVDLLNNPTADTAACKTTKGSQFCAVSDITTVVTKRVE